MIPPVERAVQRMMNSPSKPGKATFWTSTFSVSDIHSCPGDARHKNINTGYCEAGFRYMPRGGQRWKLPPLLRIIQGDIICVL